VVARAVANAVAAAALTVAEVTLVTMMTGKNGRNDEINAGRRPVHEDVRIVVKGGIQPDDDQHPMIVIMIHVVIAMHFHHTTNGAVAVTVVIRHHTDNNPDTRRHSTNRIEAITTTMPNRGIRGTLAVPNEIVIRAITDEGARVDLAVVASRRLRRPHPRLRLDPGLNERAKNAHRHRVKALRVQDMQKTRTKSRRPYGRR
jgi:hypothetical protein